MDGGLNTYGYALQNPIYYFDSLGLKELTKAELLQISRDISQPWKDGLDLIAGGGAGTVKLLLKKGLSNKGLSNKGVHEWY